MDFFYDEQCRRYLLQFMRIFSDIKIQNGPDENGNTTQSRVPIMYGDPANIVAQLIRGNSENVMLPAPMFSAYIDSISIAPTRRQDPQYVGKINATEREWTGTTYTPDMGNRYQIERYMPVPYDIIFKLDLWSTSTTHKLQLFEQISTIFNPAVQLQQNTNILDWTSIFEVELQDITWTNRVIPSGTEIQRDVMTFKFKVPVWINPPAKVKRTALIAQIVENVYYTSDVDEYRAATDDKLYDPFRCVGGIPSHIIVTPGNHKILVRKGVGGKDEVVLLTQYGVENPIQSWPDLLKAYGKIQKNITTLRLKPSENIEDYNDDIIGTIEQDPLRENILFLTVDTDTLPRTNILPIIGVVDPVLMMPGKDLPVAEPGQRYIVQGQYADGEEPVTPIAPSMSSWGNLIAYENDVIEYNGTNWKVIFSAMDADIRNYYLFNKADNTYYAFENGQWIYTYYGQYSPGYWRVDNLQVEQPTYLPDTGYAYGLDIFSSNG